MKSIATRFAAMAAIISLAACSGGGGGGAVPAANTGSSVTAPYSGPQQLADFSWGSNLMKSATYIGPAQFKTMSINVQLKMQDEQGLMQYAKEASDPHSSLYRHWLTPQEIGARFGASQATISAAQAYFNANGLATGTWPQHLMMVVTGTQNQLETAFGTKFGVFREFGKTFVAPAQAPHFQTQVPVTGVMGLVHTTLQHANIVRAGSGNFFGYSPQQLRRAFDLTGANAAGYNGSGINVGIIGTGGIWKGDVPALGTMYQTPVSPVTLVPAVNQTSGCTAPGSPPGAPCTANYDDPTGLATPPPVTGLNCSDGSSAFPAADCNPEDFEAQIDTESVAELAPGANVLFYLAFNTKDCVYGGGPSCIGAQGIVLTDDELQQAIADNKADVISMSYGGPEPQNIGYYFDSSGNGIGPVEFAALASEGIAAFASSGDDGAYSCYDPSTGNSSSTPCVSYPASDPNVVAVGGINIPLDNAGNLQPGGSITAWGTNTTTGGSGVAFNNDMGSGGGVSVVFPALTGQTGVTVANGGSLGGMRGVPDIAMDADPLSGPAFVMYANFTGQSEIVSPFGGTSVAAPEMAAAWAVVLSACKANAACSKNGYRLGNPLGLLYGVYGTGTGNGANYATTFTDVLSGGNGANIIEPTPPAFGPGYNAGTGYDLVTGIGAPSVGHLVNAIVNPATAVP